MARGTENAGRPNPGHTGSEEYNWFLAVLFPFGQFELLLKPGRG